MKAKKGEWFSLRWDILDFHDPLAFEQHKEAPRFLYAEEDSAQIEGAIINVFDRISLGSISRTTVFVTEEHGIKVPTHYKMGEFMPGDSPKYDKWLSEYHQITYSLTERVREKEALQQKKVFLEHTAKIIRHDMHSGINTYIPRGVKSLLRNLPKDVIKKYKLEGSIKLLEEGIAYSQKVYKGVYAFTSLVKEDSILETEYCNIQKALVEHISGSAYASRVHVKEIGSFPVHKVLFCTAVDNLIKGGIRFNERDEKRVDVYLEKPSTLCIKDNGVGLSKQEFLLYCKPYLRKDTAETAPRGLDLNIAVAILEDHGFSVMPERLAEGTVFRINLNPTEYLIETSKHEKVR